MSPSEKLPPPADTPPPCPTKNWADCQSCHTATWCQHFQLCLSESSPEEHPALAAAQGTARHLERMEFERPERHLPACRKLMYDIKSSPCTCQSEFDRLATECEMWQRTAEQSQAACAALRQEWKAHLEVCSESQLTALRELAQALQAEWRAAAKEEASERGPSWVGAESALTRCADDLDEMLK